MPSEDPTGTKTARTRLSQDFSARLATVRGLIRTTIDENDAFRLRDREHGPPKPVNSRMLDGSRAVDDFGVETDAERLTRFSDWLRNAFDYHVLEPTSSERVANGEHYTAQRIQQAYARGLALANIDLRQSSLPDPDTSDEGDESPSDLIGRSRHQDALSQQRTQTYGDIERATNETQTAVTRTLGSGLEAIAAGGITARVLVTRLTDRVGRPGAGGVGQTRLVLVARTRIVDTANRAIVERGVEAGVEEVGVVPETAVSPDDRDDDDETHAQYETAGDRRVCEQCAPHDGAIYTLTAVRNGEAPYPPLHPRCRCRLRLLT